MTAPRPERGERFLFQERLGAGASGSVHRAYDKQRGATVAVKVLTRVDPASVYRFKGEFRALTGIAHPNLLQLYDLVLRDGEWLLTMELVDGSDFLGHVRPLPARLRPSRANPEQLGGGEDTLGPEHFGVPLREADELPRAIANDNERTPPDDAASGTVSMMPVSQQLGPLDLGRLRNALRQLVEGLSALHGAGRLHRDLKPANVLVYASDARLVIADFGLVTEVARARDDVAENGIHGTLSYMSPEQATGEPLTEASDWYAVGVMLYQALTGVLPFAARLSVQETIAVKRQGVLVHPCSLAREAPEDLADLAVALLDPDPRKRPRYTDVVARLDGTQKRPSLGPTAPSRLVGRSAQREQLAAAFARARGGRATVALVGGRSGMGKSALVQHFLDEMRIHHRAVVLAGRCYEREELPHKAFDPLMDALSAHLRAQSEAELRDLLPANVSSLARLFPVLRRVGLVAEALGRGEVVDPFEQKRRAFAAFRELCTSLAQRQPLILFIDDLQWGDLDSAQLFGELLHGPQTPGLLLVGAYRLEDADNSPLLKMLREVSFPELGVVPVEVRVDALAETDARELALALLRGVEEPEVAAARVAAEAAGSPFLVRELSLHVRSRGAVLHGELRLDALITERLDDLPHESRALFELIAAAGRPEKRALLQAASNLGEQAFPALRVLEARNLVHSTGTGADDRIEAYHDRLRETAYKLLDGEQQRKLHRALAETMELSADRDPEALFEHWRRSDEPVRAGGFALEAARKAESQLAFARAATLYQAALAQLTLDAEQRRGTEERLGHCLALAGRGMEAADAFRRAATGAPPALAMHLRSLATTQLLRAGQFESAYRELDAAQELTGIRVPRSNLSALMMLLWRRVKIRFKRIRWRKADQAPDPHLVQRADMLWGIGAALVCMDNLLGSVYQAEHLLVALRANDPYRLARAMSVEAALAATTQTNPTRARYFLDRGLEIGGLSGEPHAIALSKGSAGTVALLKGRFREAQRLTRESQQVVRERLNATMAWDLVTAQQFDLQATAMLGSVSELVERVPEALRDAEVRGDIYAATAFRTWHCIWAWLGPNQVDEAYRQLKIAEAQWTQSGYHLQHWYMTQALGDVDLYADQPERTLTRLSGEWKKLAFIRQLQFARIEILYTRARLCLALARKRDRTKMLAAARKDANAILKEDVPWGFALGRLLLACAASFDDAALALSLVEELQGQFDALDMRLFQEVVRYRHGQLRRGEEGRAAVERAQAAIRALGVVRPEAFVAMLAPGFPGLDVFPREARDG